MEDTQNTLREAISASFDAVEAGTSNSEVSISNEKPRDEVGKFIKVENPVQETPIADPGVKKEEQDQSQQVQRPSTWKKDYLPIWDKISQGVALTPDESKKLAAYTQQRESEYKTGVSTYKAEAERAKEIHNVIEPFIPVMQQYNVNPPELVRNLLTAHQTLALGSPDQKLQMFSKIARDYGIPIEMIGNASQGNMPDQTTMQLMQQIQHLQSQVGQVANWREQQEQQQIQNEISKMDNADKYPHFQMVRGMMAQLLETGQANDLDEAYAKAVEPIEAIIESRLSQAGTNHLQSNQQAVAKAKAAAISPKSTTPSGKVAQITDAKDRRAVLAEQVEAALGGGRL